MPRKVLASTAPRMPSGATSSTEVGTLQLSYNAARHRNTIISDSVYSSGVCEPAWRSW
ncbi:hypothetical protein D3C71_1082420 [compost metagenome]